MSHHHHHHACPRVHASISLLEGLQGVDRTSPNMNRRVEPSHRDGGGPKTESLKADAFCSRGSNEDRKNSKSVVLCAICWSDIGKSVPMETCASLRMVSRSLTSRFCFFSRSSSLKRASELQRPQGVFGPALRGAPAATSPCRKSAMPIISS
mmetsp:Transcript_70630/g.134444  ORF Transcript_70630/g.134444 Transcript_70630/m.134444 type:complete len:152 (+) Transcript_70630:12-467(+)